MDTLATTGNFPYTIPPVSNITALTYRYGATEMEVLYALRDYITGTLATDYQTTLNQLITDFQAGITNAETTVTDAKTGWDDRFDAFLADITAQLAALNDASVGNLVNTPASATATALATFVDARAVKRGELMINPRDYGVTADGVNDDRAALLTALNAGTVIALPAGATIGLAGKLVVPAGKTLLTNGAVFKPLTDFGDNLIQLAGTTRVVGDLNVTVPAGMPGIRGVNLTGSATLDSVTVTATTPGQGVGNGLATALTIASTDPVTIGAVSVKNYDYPVTITTSNNTTLGNVTLDTYVRGLYLKDSGNVRIGKGTIFNASPNAALSPGHNGVLLESYSHGATHDVYLNNIAVRDSGEHGIRLGGQFRINNVWHNDCSVSNTGASGFKALGGTTASNNFHESLYWNNCIAEDCGVTDGNACGFQVQYVRSAVLANPIVRKRNKAYSAFTGIRLNKCTDVETLHPVITDTLDTCYAVDPELGDNTNVKLVGGLLSTATGNGIRINYTGITNRRVSVHGSPQIEISGTGYALSIINTGTTGTITGNAKVEFASNSAAGNIIDLVTSGFNYAGYVCEVAANFVAAANFKSGSRWVDASASNVYIKNFSKWKLQGAGGASGSRPATPALGDQFYDETLLKPVWWNGTVWKDATGTTV